MSVPHARDARYPRSTSSAYSSSRSASAAPMLMHPSHAIPYVPTAGSFDYPTVPLMHTSSAYDYDYGGMHTSSYIGDQQQAIARSLAQSPYDRAAYPTASLCERSPYPTASLCERSPYSTASAYSAPSAYERSPYSTASAYERSPYTTASPYDGGLPVPLYPPRY